MMCQKCGGDTTVIDSRVRGDMVWRKRQCQSCSEPIKTREILLEDFQMLSEIMRVVRKDRPQPWPKKSSGRHLSEAVRRKGLITRRGCDVPADREEEWRDLMRKGFRASEVKELMGL